MSPNSPRLAADSLGHNYSFNICVNCGHSAHYASINRIICPHQLTVEFKKDEMFGNDTFSLEENMAKSRKTAVEATTKPDPSTTPEPVKSPNIETVRVKLIRRKADGIIITESTHALGNFGSVCEFLPEPTRTNAIKMRDKYSLHAQSLQNGLAYITSPKLDEWQEAAAREIINCISQAEPPATELNVLTKPAILALDGALYQLNPVAICKTNGALKAMRTRMVEKLKQESNKIMAEATVNANALTQTAMEKLMKAELKLQEANHAVKWPNWALDNKLPLKLINPYERVIEVGIPVIFCPTFLEWKGEELTPERIRTPANAVGYHNITRKVWNCLPAAAFKFLMWTRLYPDGKYNYKECHTELLSLPHIHTTGACQEIGDAPKAINSYQDLRNLATATERVFKGINLASLYTYYTSWFKEAQAFVPPVLVKEMTIHLDTFVNYLGCTSFPADNIVTKPSNVWKRESEGETWNVA